MLVSLYRATLYRAKLNLIKISFPSGFAGMQTSLRIKWETNLLAGESDCSSFLPILFATRSSAFCAEFEHKLSSLELWKKDYFDQKNCWLTWQACSDHCKRTFSTILEHFLPCRSQELSPLISFRWLFYWKFFNDKHSGTFRSRTRETSWKSKDFVMKALKRRVRPKLGTCISKVELVCICVNWTSIFLQESG